MLCPTMETLTKNFNYNTEYPENFTHISEIRKRYPQPWKP